MAQIHLTCGAIAHFCYADRQHALIFRADAFPGSGVGIGAIAGMGSLRHYVRELCADEQGIPSVEYAMLLALIAGAIIMGAEMLSGAVSNKMAEAANWLDDDACGNQGGDDGTGGGDGTGQGGENAC